MRLAEKPRAIKTVLRPRRKNTACARSRSLSPLFPVANPPCKDKPLT